MSYVVRYTDVAEKVIRKWKKTNPKLFNKFVKISQELVDHPRTGSGHPKPLVGGKDITYSRHITAHDRIIYNIYDDRIVVLVVTVEGHYDDK